MRRLALLALLMSFVTCARAEERHRAWFSSVAIPDEPVHKLASTVRISIIRSKKEVEIRSDQKLQYVSLAGGRPVTIAPDKTLTFRASGDQLKLGDQRFTRSVLIAAYRPGAWIAVNGRRYRGYILVRPAGKSLIDVIEQSDMDDYLYGVLPKEVGDQWPMEALKAQAVAARTFALANIGKFESRGYDVTNDVMSQVYGGADSERPRTNAAVDETRGKILVDDDGKPIHAFFHSSCGGKTEDPRYVWRSMDHEVPYLAVRRDSYCGEDPYFNWARSISEPALRKKLRAAGYRVEEITKIRIVERTPSGRVATFKIYSSSKKVEIRGSEFRMTVGADTVRSTKITRIKNTGGAFRFEGQGWGHGVGLCQYGARGRAKDGHTYDRILSFYYPNSNLVTMRDAE